MTIHVELTVQEIAALKQMTKVDDEAQAVVTAAREFLRLIRLRELKTASGNVAFESNWRELEELELNESEPPR